MKQQNMKVSERDLVASYRRDLETDLAKEIGLRIFRNYCKECFKRSWKAKEVRVRYFFDGYCAQNANIFREALGDLVNWGVSPMPKISILLTPEVVEFEVKDIKIRYACEFYKDLSEDARNISVGEFCEKVAKEILTRGIF
ncbi:hypothetical protein I3700191H1_13770 [Megasphaera massiliensis]|uniref:hypothetical protein n=1 Tax=Megasphaera massiliensis TaxID=1232428 RepID=UPI0034BA8DE0